MSENKDDFEEVMNGVAKGCGFVLKSVGTVALGAVGLLGELGSKAPGIDMGIGKMTMDAIDAMWSDNSSSELDEQGKALKMYNTAVQGAALSIKQGNQASYDNCRNAAWKAYKIIHKDSTKDENSLYSDFEWEFDCNVRHQR